MDTATSLLITAACLSSIVCLRTMLWLEGHQTDLLSFFSLYCIFVLYCSFDVLLQIRHKVILETFTMQTK